MSKTICHVGGLPFKCTDDQMTFAFGDQHVTPGTLPDLFCFIRSLTCREHVAGLSRP